MTTSPPAPFPAVVAALPGATTTLGPATESDTPPDRDNAPLVGWCERVRLPRLGLPRLAAKIDTGARTSALHATHIERYERNDKPWVRFRVYADHRAPDQFTVVTARLRDVRAVRNSGGVQDERPVIRTDVELGRLAFRAEFTLVERTDMAFPMLLGRTALRAAGVHVDPGRQNLMRLRRRRTLSSTANTTPSSGKP